MQVLNRQQRRSQERKSEKIKTRQTFTKVEMQVSVLRAHKECRELVLQAAKESLGIGPVLLERIEERLAVLEDENYNKTFLHHLRTNKLL